AHDAKLIHRDIKPENMLLDEHNNLLLSDFGIALIAQSTRYQNTQDIIGTAAYMAPEQLQGKPRRASDQYALGIVVYEWLCGDRPFHGSFTEIYSQQLFVAPPSLQEKMPTLHPDVEAAVRMALAKEPAQRFDSVQAFAAALERACQQSFTQQNTLRPTSDVPEIPATLQETVIATPQQTVVATPQETVVAMPATPSPSALDAVTPESQPLSPPTTYAPEHTSGILFPVNRGLLPSRKAPSPASHLALQLICGFLAVLLLLSGSFLWLAHAHTSSGSTALHIIIATSTVAPTATSMPSPIPTATATAKATATPSPTPRPIPTATPSPLPTLAPTPTPSPLPMPTATPLPVIQPTLTTDCAHLVTPWVALYQYPHFGGRELCFEGKGIINLAAYGFDKQTSSINIAANGAFFDQQNGQGAQLAFYYGDEQADLGNWDSRISSFRVDS
ncbi:MAG TPA: hypothetical protein DHW02_04745, partial [Ktedonobacter sp.]|nr:hypothetical protein [Ktedonobacter sp.]